jgi:hypothetical protein
MVGRLMLYFRPPWWLLYPGKHTHRDSLLDSTMSRLCPGENDEAVCLILTEDGNWTPTAQRSRHKRTRHHCCP